jgi:hypothetical protein
VIPRRVRTSAKRISISFFRLGHGFLWGNSLTGEDGITLYGPLGPGNFKFRWAMTENQSKEQTGRARFGDNELMHWAVDYKFDVAEKQNVEIYFVGQRDRAVDNYTSLIRNSSADPVRHGDDYWVGGAYTGVAGPVALKAEIIGQFGQTRKDVCFTSSGPASITTAGELQELNTSATGAVTPGTPAVNSCSSSTPIIKDIDRKGAMFAYAEATYKMTPAWTFGMAASFATGDDDPTDDEHNNFVSPLAEWTTTPTRVWTDSQFFHGNRSGRNIGNADTNRRYNFWGRGSEDIDSAASTGDNGTKYSPGAFELQFKTKYTFNKEVTGLFNIIPVWAANAPDSSGRYMGTEIDGKIGYKPYKNLVINGYFGYFIAGGFFDVDPTGTAFDPGVTQDADDAWMFRTEAIVTF